MIDLNLGQPSPATTQTDMPPPETGDSSIRATLSFLLGRRKTGV
jgi:hypothetical protein